MAQNRESALLIAGGALLVLPWLLRNILEVSDDSSLIAFSQIAGGLLLIVGSALLFRTVIPD